jgi:hypothetical protein
VLRLSFSTETVPRVLDSADPVERWCQGSASPLWSNETSLPAMPPRWRPGRSDLKEAVKGRRFRSAPFYFGVFDPSCMQAPQGPDVAYEPDE